MAKSKFKAFKYAASYLRKLPINIVASEMALRWIAKIKIRNGYTVPAIILLCWRFTSNAIPEHAEAALGCGNLFCAEQWRVFKTMNFVVSNIEHCVCHKEMSTKKQKLVILNLLLGGSESGKQGSLLQPRREKMATAAGEIVARGRRNA